MELRHDISAVIRQVRPQVVITQSPLRNLASTYGSHPDHTADRRGHDVRGVPGRPQPVRVRRERRAPSSRTGRSTRCG